MFPDSKKYRRPYATTLIRRKNDWLVLTDVDSGPHFAWGQIAMTARDPAGAWSAPVLVSSLEGDRYYPSPVESFPSFTYGGYVYDPKTSVGANRNFQVIHRAKIEEAHRPEAWELYQHGSVWSAAWRPEEWFGIWGQTFSGFINAQGELIVLFPSRHRDGGAGTINLAFRPWGRPLRDRGFVLSAHSGSSFTLTRTAYRAFRLQARFTLQGASVRLGWGFQAPIEVQGRADGTPDPVVWTNQHGLELRAQSWRLVEADADGSVRVLAEGALNESLDRAVTLQQDASGQVTAEVDGRRVWQGTLPIREGPLALLLEPGSHLSVERLAVAGECRPAVWTFLCGEAIAGAGVSESDYRRVRSAQFRFGRGALCPQPGERVKWNFRGRGFRLWLPRGPQYGRCVVWLNGAPIAALDLNAQTDEPSKPLLAREDLPDGFHALVVRSESGTLPVDCLDALQ
jgi:hypothetical protein